MRHSIRFIRRWHLPSLLLSSGLGIWNICPAAVTVIHAGHLIEEPGAAVHERQSILIESGKISDIRAGFVPGDEVIDLSDAWVMPGLIDMHTHPSITMDIDSSNPPADFIPAFLGRPAARVLATIPRIGAILNNGFTTIRNLGDPASVMYDLRDAVNAGTVAGPRMLVSEPQFEVPGGDYAVYRWGERQDLEPLFKNRGSCTDPADCARAVRDEVRRGADVIKLRLSAQPFLDPQSGPTETPEEIAAIISTAHRLHRRVAVHSAGSSPANQMAIEAGADTIEHGYLSDENIAAMKRLGTGYTATLLVAKLAAKIIPEGNDYYEKVKVSVRKAYAAGVPILFGSDLPAVPVSRQAEEFEFLREAGLSTADALRAATTNAAKALGLQDSVGSIGRGKVADIIAVHGNPLDDLREMTKVVFVMKGGQVVKYSTVGRHSTPARDGRR